MFLKELFHEVIHLDCGEKEADWDRGAGDQEEGKGVDLHSKAASWGRSLQGPDCGWRNKVCHRKDNLIKTGDDSYVRTKTVEAARADGEKIRLIGGAEANALEAVGR